IRRRCATEVCEGMIMAAGVRYVYDRAGFAQLVNGAGVASYVDAVAKAGLGYAQSIAPVGETGNYRDSLSSSSGREHSFRSLRPVGYVSDNVDYGAIVEMHH